MDIERLVEKRTREQREFARTFSTFKRIKYRPDIDYRRKRGVLEEINRTIESVEREAQILRELDASSVGLPDGEVEYFRTRWSMRTTEPTTSNGDRSDSDSDEGESSRSEGDE